MDYAAAIAALDGLEGLGMRLGLERIEALLGVLANPERGLRGALVAGTNGKGSVSALVEAMARAAGLRTVLLTKPHLLSWCERIAVDGTPVTEQRFADLVAEVLAARPSLPAELASPTVFEVLTAAGILAAREAAPDVLVCEVGLGGRLDSTNVLDLGVAVVTEVGLDHRQQLGDSIAEIAPEKAAIIKRGNHVVTGTDGEALDIVRRRAREVDAAAVLEVGTELTWRGEDRGRHGVAIELEATGLRLATPLIGAFQQRNLAVAAGVAMSLGRRGMEIDDAAMARGAAAVRWPGRMQWIGGRPDLLVDGCHNPEAVAAMVAGAAPLCAGRRVVGVFGAMADKDVAAMLAALRPLGADLVFTAPSSGRAARPDALAALWGDNRSAVTATVPEALDVASRRAGDDGVVVACGSLYVAGEVLEALGARPGQGLDLTVDAPVSRPGRRRAWL